MSVILFVFVNVSPINLIDLARWVKFNPSIIYGLELIKLIKLINQNLILNYTVATFNP